MNAPNGLHRNAYLESRLDAMLRRYRDDWQWLDQLHPTLFTPHEQVHLDMVKVGVEQVEQRLAAMFKENAGKKIGDWQ